MIFKDSIKILLLILITSTTLSSCLNGYFIPKRQLKYAKQFAPFEVIIVPGIPYKPELGWDYTMQTRVLWGVHLYKEGLAENIIFTGSNVYSPYYESEIMRLYALELGVPDSVIYTEKEAKHGVENMYYSYIMAKDLGFEKIALATDPAQNLQIGYYGRPFADHVVLMPADVDLLQVPYADSIVIDPLEAYGADFTTYEDEPLINRLWRSSGRGGMKKKMKKYLKAERKKLA